MRVWTEISNLARRLLGVDAHAPVDLSKIDQDLAPIPSSRQKDPQPPAGQDSEPIEVLPEYQFVLEAIKAGCPAVFVTGRAGTGKSTLIRFLSEKITNCAVVAPTALAAINVHGSTILSLIHI